MTLSGSLSASDMSGQTVLTAEDVDIDVVGEGDDCLEEREGGGGASDAEAGGSPSLVVAAASGSPYGRAYGLPHGAYPHPAALQYPYIPPVGPMLPPAVPLLPSSELTRKAFNSQLSPSLQLQLSGLSAAAAAAAAVGGSVAGGGGGGGVKAEPASRPSFSIENIIGGGGGGAGIGGPVASSSSGSAQTFLRPPVTVQSGLLGHQPLALARSTAAIAPILSVPTNIISGQFLQPATSATAVQAKWPAQ